MEVGVLACFRCNCHDRRRRFEEEDEENCSLPQGERPSSLQLSFSHTQTLCSHSRIHFRVHHFIRLLSMFLEEEGGEGISISPFVSKSTFPVPVPFGSGESCSPNLVVHDHSFIFRHLDRQTCSNFPCFLRVFCFVFLFMFLFVEILLFY